MPQLILIRHGESEWNRDNRFTGWADVGLTERGRTDMHAAGALLRKEGFLIDLAFTSLLSSDRQGFLEGPQRAVILRSRLGASPY